VKLIGLLPVALLVAVPLVACSSDKTTPDSNHPASSSAAKGDVITSLDDVQLQNQTDLTAALAGKAIRTIHLAVKHANGRKEIVTATPGSSVETGVAPFARPV
jgi:hypothetical protein